MLQPQRRSARLLGAVAATLALVGASLTIAAPAYALPTPVNESFESGARDRWTAVPTDRVVFGFNTLAQSGVAVADMNAIGLSSKVRMYRTLAINFVGSGPVWCGAAVSMRKEALRAADTIVDLRVHRAGPDSELLIPEKTVTVNKFSEWTYFPFGGENPDTGTVSTTWPWQEAAFTVEITAFNSRILVDDLLISCVRSPR